MTILLLLHTEMPKQHPFVQSMPIRAVEVPMASDIKRGAEHIINKQIVDLQHVDLRSMLQTSTESQLKCDPGSLSLHCMGDDATNERRASHDESTPTDTQKPIQKHITAEFAQVA